MTEAAQDQVAAVTRALEQECGFDPDAEEYIVTALHDRLRTRARLGLEYRLVFWDGAFHVESGAVEANSPYAERAERLG